MPKRLTSAEKVLQLLAGQGYGAECWESMLLG